MFLSCFEISFEIIIVFCNSLLFTSFHKFSTENYVWKDDCDNWTMKEYSCTIFAGIFFCNYIFFHFISIFNDSFHPIPMTDNINTLQINFHQTKSF